MNISCNLFDINEIYLFAMSILIDSYLLYKIVSISTKCFINAPKVSGKHCHNSANFKVPAGMEGQNSHCCGKPFQVHFHHIQIVF